MPDLAAPVPSGDPGVGHPSWSAGLAERVHALLVECIVLDPGAVDEAGRAEACPRMRVYDARDDTREDNGESRHVARSSPQAKVTIKSLDSEYQSRSRLAFCLLSTLSAFFSLSYRPLFLLALLPHTYFLCLRRAGHLITVNQMYLTV